MTVSVARYYQREKITLDCTILTPMFLGGADQRAALSAAPIKAALRYWWRVSGVHNAENSEDLFKKENCLFGNADEKFGKSKVSFLMSLKNMHLSESKENISTGDVKNVKFRLGNISLNVFVYLGMGIIDFRQNNDKMIKIDNERSYFKPESVFKIEIISPKKSSVLYEELVKSIFLFSEFGALGSRSRNGWGSIQVSSNIDRERLFKELLKIAKPMENCFSVDYPHCLGIDDRGRISIWQSKVKSSWQECMADFGSIYGNLRKIFPTKGKMGLPGDRLLLGYPIPKPIPKIAGWQGARFSSPLRFVVKKTDNQFVYRVVHVPALIPKDLNKNNQKKEIWSPDQQKKIWDTVHQHLDDKLGRLTQV